MSSVVTVPTAPSRMGSFTYVTAGVSGRLSPAITASSPDAEAGLQGLRTPPVDSSRKGILSERIKVIIIKDFSKMSFP